MRSNCAQRAQILHELSETDLRAELPLDQRCRLGQQQRVETQFKQVGGRIDAGQVITR